MENASFVREGCTGATSDSAGGTGVGCNGAARRWATPPLRTTGCLKTRAARCIFLGLELAPEGSLLHPYIGKFRFAKLRRAASWLRLRFVADMTPPWAVRDFQEGQRDRSDSGVRSPWSSSRASRVCLRSSRRTTHTCRREPRRIDLSELVAQVAHLKAFSKRLSRCSAAP